MNKLERLVSFQLFKRDGRRISKRNAAFGIKCALRGFEHGLRFFFIDLHLATMLQP